MKERGAKVSVVSPVFGCAPCLEELVDRIQASLSQLERDHEIILVDDGSPDNAWARIVEISEHRAEVRGLRLSRNFGQHAAITAGLKAATGEVIVVLDCDLQDVPEEIPELLMALTDGTDVVFATRAQRRDPLLKRIGSFAFYAALRWLTDSDYDHSVANFGAYNRKVIDTVLSMSEADGVFPLLVRWSGFKRVTVPVVHATRTHGRSSYSLRRLLRLALNIALSYSDKPLRMMVKFSAVFAAAALLIAAQSIYLYSVGDIQVAGFTSIIASIWLVGSAIVFCIGMVGLYLGRVYNEVKGRPRYIVSDVTGGSIDG